MGSMFDTKRYLCKLQAYWPWWLALGLAVFVAGNAVGLLLPKKYASTAQIQIIPPLSVGRGDNLLDPTNQLRVIKDRILSPNYYDSYEPGDRSIIDQLGLAKGVNPKSLQFQQLKRGIAERMQVWLRSNNTVDMSYWDYNPVVARDVLRKVIDKWGTETERRIVRATTNNKALVEAQSKQAEDRLSSTSAAVLAFKQKHPEARDEIYTELRSRRDDMIKTRTANMQKTKGLRDSITLAEEQLKRESQASTPQKRMARANPQLQEMMVELARAERELTIMLQTFTEKHQRVIEQRKKIQIQKDMIETAAKNAPPPELEQIATDPMWQARRDVDKLKLELRATETMVAEADKDIAQLDEGMAKIPALQVTLNDLLRRETLHRGDAESLRSKLATADSLDSAQIRDQYGFTIDEFKSPEVPMSPSAPRQSMIMGLSGAMSVGFVAAMVWLAMILDLAVRSVEEARLLLRMPVLGVVQPIPASRRKRRKLAA